MNSEKANPETKDASNNAGGVDWRFIAIVLLATIIPFLLFARQIESLVSDWVKQPTTPATVWLLVIGLLWADILLPVPSSVVTTFAGAKLGWLSAAIASDVGMTLAAITAFALGRFADRLRISRLSAKQETVGAASVNRWGPWAIVISRGIPLVAEIVLIYVAARRISFWAFLWPTVVASTLISLGYAILGQWAADREWLAIVLGASGVFPLLLGLAVRQWLLRR
jgi:uncharacterized membrane protein YdjX (TVP38/TMEM64 family)